MNITEETIDSFLRGDLNSIETEAFNKAVSADPKLQQEVSIQKDIIDSVKQHRHQQLKNRLNAIDIKPVGIGFYASPYIKLAASIGIVALIVGSFSLFSNKDDSPTVSVESNATDMTATAKEETASALSQNTNSASETAVTTSNSAKTTEASKPTTVSGSKSANSSSSNINTQKGTSDAPLADISEEPLDTDNTIDGINDNFDMPTMNHGGNTSNISSPQIKVSIVKENNLGYRFINNQLFLHGNFSNSTYELYELNNKPSKQLFLYFENNYYELIQGKTKVTSLTPITDKAILLQLTQLREH